ncbi:MAG TPA: hypothetical protein VEF71_13345 [Streptosporangiaceae bacterium]|nr:hypothetical protein [Streptosporangiaceae bacterium]
MAAVLLAAVMVELLAFMGVSGALTGTVTAGKLWARLSLLTIVLVTAVVGLVVASHQPRNPIGWLLAGEAVFILLSVASGAYANMVYRLGYHDLAFAGPPTLVLGQLFSFMLIGFPLVILLFPDGRLPSPRWRPVVDLPGCHRRCRPGHQRRRADPGRGAPRRPAGRREPFIPWPLRHGLGVPGDGGVRCHGGGFLACPPSAARPSAGGVPTASAASS